MPLSNKEKGLKAAENCNPIAKHNMTYSFSKVHLAPSQDNVGAHRDCRLSLGSFPHPNLTRRKPATILAACIRSPVPSPISNLHVYWTLQQYKSSRRGTYPRVSSDVEWASDLHTERLNFGEFLRTPRNQAIRMANPRHAYECYYG
jgi:hypothetical protein